MYKEVQIWPGQTVTCLHTNSPDHIWTTLYIHTVLLASFAALLKTLLNSFLPYETKFRFISPSFTLFTSERFAFFPIFLHQKDKREMPRNLEICRLFFFNLSLFLSQVSKCQYNTLLLRYTTKEHFHATWSKTGHPTCGPHENFSKTSFRLSN